MFAKNQYVLRVYFVKINYKIIKTVCVNDSNGVEGTRKVMFNVESVRMLRYYK